jgi:hypothetical protein
LFATWHILAHVLGLQRNTWRLFLFASMLRETVTFVPFTVACHQQVDPVRASAARSLDAKTLPPRNLSEACSSTRVDLAREVNQVIGYIGYSWLFMVIHGYSRLPPASQFAVTCFPLLRSICRFPVLFWFFWTANMRQRKTRHFPSEVDDHKAGRIARGPTAAAHLIMCHWQIGQAFFPFCRSKFKFGFKTPSQLVPMLPYFDIYLHYFAPFFPGQIPSSFNGHHHSALIGPGFETYLPSWDGLKFVKRG